MNRKGFVAIPFATNLALSTLGDDTVLKVATHGSAFGEDIFLISGDFFFSVQNSTSGEFPLIYGVAHNDLSVTEIKEALEAELTDPDDLIVKERTKRPVRKIAIQNDTNVPMNDGKPIRQKLGFTVGDGHSLALFVYNQSGATLTTGTIIEMNGTLFGRWQR